MVDLLKKLISFQTDKNHLKEIKSCFDFLNIYLRNAGLKVKLYSYKGSISLVASKVLKKHYQFILNGHIDVVPASYKNAFNPQVKSGRLYGRGASDMKGPVSSLIELVKDKDLIKKDIALILTSDEETGGYNGVDYLVNKKGYSCDCVIIPDGGNNFELVLKEKGLIHVKLISFGKASHGSQPWLGKNAIDILINLYLELKKNIPETKPGNRWQPTLNLGKLSGGDAVNKVPGQAEMYLDFRFPQKSQKQKILNLLKKLCQKYKANLKIKSIGDLLDTKAKNKYIQ